jgi:hypothetical protein
MQLFFAEVIALAVGLVLHQVLPRRVQTGVVLLPAIAGAATAIVWVALTWARLPQDGAVIWVTSLGCGVLSALAAGLLLRRARARADDARLATAART